MVATSGSKWRKIGAEVNAVFSWSKNLFAFCVPEVFFWFFMFEFEFGFGAFTVDSRVTFSWFSGLWSKLNRGWHRFEYLWINLPTRPCDLSCPCNSGLIRSLDSSFRPSKSLGINLYNWVQAPQVQARASSATGNQFRAGFSLKSSWAFPYQKQWEWGLVREVKISLISTLRECVVY